VSFLSDLVKHLIRIADENAAMHENMVLPLKAGLQSSS